MGDAECLAAFGSFSAVQFSGAVPVCVLYRHVTVFALGDVAIEVVGLCCVGIKGEESNAFKHDAVGVSAVAPYSGDVLE